MRRIISSPFRTVARAMKADRKGTVLLLALGTVGIISVAAVSYVTIVRLDRRSAVIAARESGLDRQVQTVVDYIGSLLAADLYGNKIVTPDVPLEAWPGMFEDGEYRDLAFLPDESLNTFRDTDPGEQPNEQSLLELDDVSYERAFQDDAWLASFDPVDSNDNPFGPISQAYDQALTWPQITNLRSAYEWSGSEWVRQDGRFVDLAQWLIQNTDEFADPAINLVDWDANNVSDFEGQLGPEAGRFQEIFDLQMNRVGEDFTGDSNNPVAGFLSNDIATDDRFDAGDTRMWADTDGDLRPDARWTVLDALGNAAGYNWVVAARVIDASALINANSSIEFAGDGIGPGEFVGDGRTPVDVDFFRLLEEADQLTNNRTYQFQVRTNKLNAAFDTHIDQDMDMPAVLEAAKQYDLQNLTIDFGYQNFITPTTDVWRPTQGMRRQERFAYYDLIGKSPDLPEITAGRTIEQRDIYDLLAFHGSNNATVLSRMEQRFDRGGFRDRGYLPGSPIRNIHGPLRANEDANLSRVFETAARPGRPSRREILENNPRRLLTLFSGVGQASPVPVINTTENPDTGEPYFDGIYRRDKIRLNNGPLTADQVERSFEAFMWALAPLETNMEIYPGYQGNPSRNRTYGRDAFAGNERGPAVAIDSNRTLTFNFSPTERGFSLGSFPVFVAGALATNLRDATDDDNLPHVVTFDGDEDTPSNSHNVALDRHLAHGSIPKTRLAPYGLGPEQPGPITWIGLERQPFLTEVSFVSIYTDFSTDGAGDDSGIIGDSAADELGSAIFVEIANPWSTPLTTEGWVVEIASDGQGALGNGLQLILPDGLVIPEGDRTIFHWVYDNGADTSVWQTDGFRDEILADIGVPGADATRIGTILDDQESPIAADDRIPFRALTGPVSAVLTIPAAPGGPSGIDQPNVPVDRVAAPPGSDFPRVWTARGGFNIGADLVTSFGPGVYDAGRIIGFYPNAVPPGDIATIDTALASGQGRGRLKATSTLIRAHGGQAQSFPAYMLEDRERNHVINRDDVIAWVDPAVDPMKFTVMVPDLRTTPIEILEPFDAVTFPFNWPDAHVDLGQLGKPDHPNNWSPQEVPAFQVWVGEGNAAPSSRPKINSVADLGLVSIYGHFIRGGADQVRALSTLTTWSEFMAQSRFYDFSTPRNDPGGPDKLNPYMGVLDFSRHILGRMEPGGAVQAPNWMRVPLATRVFDCFEAIRTEPGRLVPGRINVNTAPARVLDKLPLMQPEVGASVPLATPANDRLSLLSLYRSAGTAGTPFPREGPVLTNLIGLRTGEEPDPDDGFVASGELAILDRWTFNAGSGAPDFNTPTRAFLQIGTDGQNADGLGDPNNILELIDDYADPGFNPIDDAEERLAAYRAIANIVSTRSDVFIAWFVLRGYDPDQIEQIRIDGAQARNDALQAMEDPEKGFGPAYESRWLVVYDRSNVERPTDRPRALLVIELPVTAG